jgi:methylated-DNA-[protein]-cysteine S-methyltransferase
VEAQAGVSVWRHRELSTPLGDWLLAESSRGLVFVGLSAERALAGLWKLRKRARANCELKHAPDSCQAAARQLLEYARGERQDFDLELDPIGSAFDLRVWAELRRIPFGQTSSYGEIARRLGNPGLARAVGGANGRNPLPVIVPCHRVLANSGEGGYSGGLATKRRLLQHEGCAVSSGLFAS